MKKLYVVDWWEMWENESELVIIRFSFFFVGLDDIVMWGFKLCKVVDVKLIVIGYLYENCVLDLG